MEIFFQDNKTLLKHLLNFTTKWLHRRSFPVNILIFPYTSIKSGTSLWSGINAADFKVCLTIEFSSSIGKARVIFCPVVYREKDRRQKRSSQYVCKICLFGTQHFSGKSYRKFSDSFCSWWGTCCESEIWLKKTFYCPFRYTSRMDCNKREWEHRCLWPSSKWVLFWSTSYCI